MKTSFFVVIVIVFQIAHSRTAVGETQDDLNDALGFSRISILNLNAQMIGTVTEGFSLPEQEADLNKFIIEKLAEAMIAKITNEDPGDLNIRVTAELAVERCQDASDQRNINEAYNEIANCSFFYHTKTLFSF